MRDAEAHVVAELDETRNQTNAVLFQSGEEARLHNRLQTLSIHFIVATEECLHRGSRLQLFHRPIVTVHYNTYVLYTSLNFS